MSRKYRIYKNPDHHKSMLTIEGFEDRFTTTYYEWFQLFRSIETQRENAQYNNILRLDSLGSGWCSLQGPYRGNPPLFLSDAELGDLHSQFLDLDPPEGTAENQPRFFLAHLERARRFHREVQHLRRWAEAFEDAKGILESVTDGGRLWAQLSKARDLISEGKGPGGVLHRVFLEVVKLHKHNLRLEHELKTVHAQIWLRKNRQEYSWSSFLFGRNKRVEQEELRATQEIVKIKFLSRAMSTVSRLRWHAMRQGESGELLHYWMDLLNASMYTGEPRFKLDMIEEAVLNLERYEDEFFEKNRG